MDRKRTFVMGSSGTNPSENPDSRVSKAALASSYRRSKRTYRSRKEGTGTLYSAKNFWMLGTEVSVRRLAFLYCTTSLPSAALYLIVLY